MFAEYLRYRGFGAGKELCKSKGRAGWAVTFLLNPALQGLIQPLCWLPKAHTEWLFWDKATQSVTLEMFGERLNKIN